MRLIFYDSFSIIRSYKSRLLLEIIERDAINTRNNSDYGLIRQTLRKVHILNE